MPRTPSHPKSVPNLDAPTETPSELDSDALKADELSLADLRVSPETLDGVTKRSILTVPVTKPPKQAWVRVHRTYAEDVGLLIWKRPAKHTS